MFMQQPEAGRLVQAAAAEILAGRTKEAAELLDLALAADPNNAMALTKQAELALAAKDHVRGLALTDAVLGMEPNFAPAWHVRASALWLAARKAEALHAANRAVDIQPPNPEFRLRLAQFSAWTGHGSTVPDILQPLLADTAPDPRYHAAAVAMLGEQAVAEGRFADAAPLLDRALEMMPDLTVVRMLRGMNTLRRGRLGEGWADYASREEIPELYPAGRVTWVAEPWHGQGLSGKTILVTDDQGHGDAIQFFRYLPLLRDRGAARVTWRTFPPLLRLLADSAPYANVVNAVPVDARFDYHCNSTSLSRWFGTEMDSIPAPIRYLLPPANPALTPTRVDIVVPLFNSRHGSADPGDLFQHPAATGGPVTPIHDEGRGEPAATRAGRTPKTAAERTLRVGLVWSGDQRLTRDHVRSIPAEQFLRLTDLPRADGVKFEFHSLQHTIRPNDLPALQARPAVRRDVEHAADFADTASLIEPLDLVIAVDTGVVHLAAALGKPVWLVVHVAAGWRWLIDRADSPWSRPCGCSASHRPSGWRLSATVRLRRSARFATARRSAQRRRPPPGLTGPRYWIAPPRRCGLLRRPD